MPFANMTEGGNFTPAPAGTNSARLLIAADLGTQDTPYGEKRQARLTWALPTELMDDDRPFSIGNFYTATLNRKGNLRQDLESWLGRLMTVEEIQNFSWDLVKDLPCFLTVTHKTTDDGSTRARITNVGGVPKRTIVSALSDEVLIFDLESPDWKVFEQLPDWIKEKIQASPEYKACRSNGEDTPLAQTEEGPDDVEILRDI